MHPIDWMFIGCRVERAVRVNTVGTFGISSASQCWSRVAGAIGCVAQYLAGHSWAIWHMLVADDFHLEAGGQDHRFAFRCFFILCAVAGIPLSWCERESHKRKDGTFHDDAHDAPVRTNKHSVSWRFYLVSPWRLDRPSGSRQDTHGTLEPLRRKAVGGSTSRARARDTGHRHKC